VFKSRFDRDRGSDHINSLSTAPTKANSRELAYSKVLNQKKIDRLGHESHLVHIIVAFWLFMKANRVNIKHDCLWYLYAQDWKRPI